MSEKDDRIRAVLRAVAGWAKSGREVAVVFHRALSAIYLAAWLSLLVQVRVLIGSRGLLPLVEFVDALRDEGLLSFRVLPSVLAWFPSDFALVAGCVAGVALSLLGLFGVRPRLLAALQTTLYLSYVAACQSFLAFQWDNLLLECGLLAAFLPVDRSAPVAHFLLRALAFKLYFESGIAKWQSPILDWRDGSAMTYYYETAPLPTALAWRAHHLPRWWHLVESRATLALELVGPLLFFGPRRLRIGAAVAFTLFQLGNALTGNYGFFCFLSIVLHLFLLDDADVIWMRARVKRWLRIRDRASAAPPPADAPADAPAAPGNPYTSRPFAMLGAAAWLFMSLAAGFFRFSDSNAARALIPVVQLTQAFRLVNTYHLFASVTRDRIEADIQSQTSGSWTSHDLRYKPGDPMRPPRFVAPHQPRVDFQLWFYGLGYTRRPPMYIVNLLARLCEDPTAVQPLFVAPLPQAADAVRVVFWDYRFTSPAEMRDGGGWWKRREVGSLDPVRCTR